MQHAKNTVVKRNMRFHYHSQILRHYDTGLNTNESQYILYIYNIPVRLSASKDNLNFFLFHYKLKRSFPNNRK